MCKATPRQCKQTSTGREDYQTERNQTVLKRATFVDSLVVDVDIPVL